MKPAKTHSGVAGVATQVIIEPEDIKRPDHNATIDVWFLTIPGQAIFWSDYIIGIYHLRDVPGVPPARKVYDGVTHELALIALDPDRHPKALDMQTWRHMTPLNFVIQLELPSDEAAKELAELAVRGVVDGVLWAEPPLSGQQEPWRTSMLKTAAHLRGEVHGS